MLKRHHSDLSDSLDFKAMLYDSSFSDTIEYASVETAENLGAQVNESIELFSFCIVNNAEKEETLKYLRHAVDFGVANFLYANNIGKEISFTLDGIEVSLTPEENPAYKHVAIWLKTFYAALILRSQNELQEMASIDQSVFEKSNIKPNSFDLANFHLHRALFDSNANLSESFQNAADASDPSHIEPIRQNYIFDLQTPVLKLIHDVLTNNEESFNIELEKALELHLQFWSKSENVDEYYGWISLPLTAICALAVDNKEFNIMVESEYLPSWLYKKEF